MEFPQEFDYLTLVRVKLAAGELRGLPACLDQFIRTAEGEVVLLTLYAKAKTDNLTGAKLKEIRRALEE